MSLPERPQHLSLEMKHRLGALTLDVSFQLTQPWTVLFGPSGSGKSTVLRTIVGLIKPQDGVVSLHWRGQRQVATDTTAGVMISPHKRFVRWAAQRPALFPHMTVRENLCLSAETPDQPIDQAIERFRLTHVANAMPATISGGEQQRVSIARAAIAAEGRLLLLDEPFSGLDASLRDELLGDLQAWLSESQTPVFSVTHDIAEAFQLKAEVIKLHQGRVVQQGPAEVVLAEERQRLLAQLVAKD